MDKTVFLTGGTGSFGMEFVKLLLTQLDIKMIRIFSRDEHKQAKMRKLLKSDRISYFIGDVRDQERLKDAMSGSQWVIHAAALKQAPLGEIEAQEFIKTNILGSMNVLAASRYCGIEKGILLSSDKAVEPINLYGASKMCAERLFLQADKLRGNHAARFACVRYGNVACTNGSVIPIFQALKDNEPTPICDPLATRFWITLGQATRFVLQSLRAMRGGEVFIPQLKSVMIIDIAEAIRPGKPIVCIGERPGEKRHEVLKVEYDGERYSSDKNHFMTVEEIKEAVNPYACVS